MSDWVWLVPLLPFVAFLIITLFSRALPRRADLVAIGAMGVAWLVSLSVLIAALGGSDLPSFHFTWATLGRVPITLGYRVDALSAVMLFLVTFVSLMVQIYSTGYMKGDVRYARYYGILSLFSFSMIVLVMASDLLTLFIAWELVGLCSYLLIGHWYEDREVRYAAVKAFIITRIGDIALLLGLVLLFAATHSFDFATINAAVASGALSGALITVSALLVFGGAVGKSAQFPLHVWLPDAMAGPTPVSALIHAATMVAAGVYLVARAYHLFAPSPDALSALAWIGGFTAVFAASMGLVMVDIKRVLAYSTVSQLGYMMLALGVGGYSAGLFHLTTHAFFKALLFLAAGSVIHAVETQDMFRLGGLAKKMPITTVTWLIGAAALIGIPPFAGYWSKDAIMAVAYGSHFAIPFAFGLIGIGFTAFYTTRATLLTFFGMPRDQKLHDHAHESSPVMTIPLLILAAFAACAGFANAGWFGHAFSHFVYFDHVPAAPDSAVASWLVTAAWLIGLVWAGLLYRRSVTEPGPSRAALRPIWTLLTERYYLSRFYDQIGTGFIAFATGLHVFDRDVVEGGGNGIGKFLSWSGRALRLAESGRVQLYATVVFAGLVAGLAVFGFTE